MDRMMEHTQQTLTVDAYSSEGDGVARLDGAAVFVSGGLRGEICRVYLDKVGRSAVWGHVEEVLTSRGQAVLGRQHVSPTPWLTKRHGYDPTYFF